MRPTVAQTVVTSTLIVAFAAIGASPSIAQTRLTSLDDSKALILTESNGAMDLRSVPLP